LIFTFSVVESQTAPVDLHGLRSKNFPDFPACACYRWRWERLGQLETWRAESDGHRWPTLLICSISLIIARSIGQPVGRPGRLADRLMDERQKTGAWWTCFIQTVVGRWSRAGPPIWKRQGPN